MLQEQIDGLLTREELTKSNISLVEEELKTLKGELNIIRKARRSMEKYEEQLNNGNESHEHLELTVSD